MMSAPIAPPTLATRLRRVLAALRSAMSAWIGAEDPEPDARGGGGAIG